MTTENPPESEPDKPDNVVEFRQRPENLPWNPETELLASIKSHYSYPAEHKHGPFVVDDKERTVECKRCGKLVDPIYVICMIASEWQHAQYAVEEYARLRKEEIEKRKRREERRNKNGTKLT